MKIGRLKTSTKPTRLIFYDCETLPEKYCADKSIELHSLRLGVAISGRLRDGKLIGRKEHRFTTHDGFLDWLDSQLVRKQTTWLLAHNAGFDAQVSGLLSAVKSGRYRFVTRDIKAEPAEPDSIWAEKTARFMVISDPPTIMHLETLDGRRFIVLDSMNFVPMPLATLGDLMALPKGKMPDWDRPDSEWFEYCLRDVEILERWFLRYVTFIEENQLGSVKWTASGQSMTAYRTRFIPKEIESHQVTEVRELEREGYFGGEFRCFRLGETCEQVFHLDANSLYPSVMRGRLYPYKLKRWFWNDRWENLPVSFDPSEAVAEVFISTDGEEYLKRIGDDPMPVVGNFSTVLCGPELVKAFERGHVLGVKRWATYEMAELFTDYVDSIYQLRRDCARKGMKDYAHFAKMLLNSLYGKFGQRGSSLLFRPNRSCPIEFGEWRVCKPSTGERWNYVVLGGDVYEQVQRKELRSSFPVLSAFIASAARERMRELRTIAGLDSTIYQAVDSLIVTEPGFERLKQALELDQTALGKLKIQATALGVKIHGHGWYQIGERQVLPGRKREVAVNEKKGYRQTQFSGLRSSLFTPPDDIIWSTKRFVRFPEAFRRGTVQPDGLVKPIMLSEDCPF